jgi:hypothetical protein
LRVRSLSTTLSAAAVAAGALVVAGTAAAQNPAATTVPLSGGTTFLQLDRGTANFLAGAGVRVAPVGPARAQGLEVRFPVTGGRIDPQTAGGVVNHSGGLSFSAGRTTVRATNFRVQTGLRPVLTAQVGSARVPLANLSTSNAVVLRRGAGRVDTWVVRVNANLHPVAARALSAAFGTRVPAGARIGRVDMRTQAAQVLLTGGATSLTLDAGTAAALTSLGVAPSLIEPATAGDRGTLDFPITGGRLAVDGFAGEIPHSGGIALTAGQTRVELRNFIIEISGSPRLTAQVGDTDTRIPLALDLSGIRAGLSARNAVVRDARVALTAEAAAALNAAFGVNAFAAGVPLGIADVRGQVR